MSVRPENWDTTVFETRPESTERIIAQGDVGHAMAVYMAVFARNPWNYNVGFATPTNENPVNNAPLPLFWECPLLPKFLEEGKIFQGRIYENDGIKQADLFIAIDDFLDYVTALSKYLESPKARLLSESTYEEMASYWQRATEQIKELDKTKNPKTRNYIRLVNSYPLTGLLGLYDYEELSDPNVYLMGVVDGEFVRFNKDNQIKEGQECTTILRTRKYKGNILESVIMEGKEEGLPLTEEVANQIREFWNQIPENQGENEIMMLGDIASLVEGQGEAIITYLGFATIVNKEPKVDTFAYFTRSDSVTYKPKRTISFINRIYEPQNSFDTNPAMLDWKGPDGVDYRLVVITRKHE